MRIAYFDCFAGISGDMTIGALLEVGVDFHALSVELSKLGLRDYRLHESRVVRNGLAARKFDVAVLKSNDVARLTPHAKSPGTVSKKGAKTAADARKKSAHPHSHRSLREIVEIIETSSLRAGAKDIARRIFERLGAAEAKVHDVPLEEVHFHEVGAVDSIIDVVGSAICFDWLAVDQIIASPINVGAGFVDCDHGRFPVPGPATAELLKGIPIYSEGPEVELATPTGAAIISTVASGFRRLREFQSTSIGYGAGRREIEGFPNVLRVMVGEGPAAQDSTSGGAAEMVKIIEANIDDMNPQIYGYFLEKALSLGALDVYLTPVQMKKNRPGHCLTVMCEPTKEVALTRLIFAETTTIGLRVHGAQRRVLDRSMDTIETRFGRVRVKIARLNGSVLNVGPEFDDCQRLAQEKGIPLKEILAEANARIQALKP